MYSRRKRLVTESGDAKIRRTHMLPQTKDVRGQAFSAEKNGICQQTFHVTLACVLRTHAPVPIAIAPHQHRENVPQGNPHVKHLAKKRSIQLDCQ